MVETVSISSADELVKHLDSLEENPLDEAGARELWDVWEFRESNGADDYLMLVQPWLVREELGIRRPFFFGEVEHDDEDKGAILFSSLRTVDISILENQVWEQVTATETLEEVDISDTSDYIDDPGKMWLPRSQMTVFEYDV